MEKHSNRVWKYIKKNAIGETRVKAKELSEKLKLSRKYIYRIITYLRHRGYAVHNTTYGYVASEDATMIEDFKFARTLLARRNSISVIARVSSPFMMERTGLAPVKRLYDYLHEASKNKFRDDSDMLMEELIVEQEALIDASQPDPTK